MARVIKRIRLLVLFFVLILSFFTISNIKIEASSQITKTYLKEESKESTDDEHSEEEEALHGGYNQSTTCDSFTNEEDKKQCEKDMNTRVKTPSFIQKAMMSQDPVIAEQEKSEDYIMNFSNSSVTAMTKSLDLFSPDTIPMTLINILTSLLEKLGSFVSLIVMILYNLAVSSFWVSIVQSILDVLDGILFDWSDPNSYFMKVVCLFGFLTVIRRIMNSMKKSLTITGAISVIFEVVLSCALIVFVARYGRPLIQYTEDLMSKSIIETFNLSDSDDGTPVEIQNKRMIFNVLQRQGFVLRHYGTTDETQVESAKMNDESATEYTGVQRVHLLLNEPSRASAWAERAAFGNDDITYNSLQAMNVFGLSFLFMIHRMLLAIMLGIGSALLIAIGFMKEILLGLSVYGLLFMLFREEKKLAAKWFSGRLQWSILFIFSHVMFSILLFFVASMVNEISKIGLLFLLPFDAILALGMYQIYKNKDDILKKLTASVDPEGKGMMNVVKGIITGDVQPKDVVQNIKAENVKTSTTETEGSGSSGSKDSSAIGNIKNDDDLAEKETTKEQDDDTKDKVEDTPEGEDEKGGEETEIEPKDELTDGEKAESADTEAGSSASKLNDRDLSESSDEEDEEDDPLKKRSQLPVNDPETAEQDEDGENQTDDKTQKENQESSELKDDRSKVDYGVNADLAESTTPDDAYSSKENNYKGSNPDLSDSSDYNAEKDETIKPKKNEKSYGESDPNLDKKQVKSDADDINEMFEKSQKQKISAMDDFMKDFDMESGAGDYETDPEI